MQRILIVEDDEKLRKEMEIFFCQNGYQAESLSTFDNTVAAILEKKADILLLDINLPNQDGEYICKEVRKQSQVPIIMVTSRESELDELISLTYGADQYVTKPFHSQILLAKVNALLRRSYLGATQDKIYAPDFVINLSNSTVSNGVQEVALTKNEIRILKFLTEKRGTIVSREEIINDLWESDSFIDDNTLTVNMTRLRNKLGEMQLQELLETKRGQGYRLKQGGNHDIS